MLRWCCLLFGLVSFVFVVVGSSSQPELAEPCSISSAQNILDDDFYYIWSSNGTNGYLIDMIRFKLSSALRIAVFDLRESPQAKVIWQRYDYDSFHVYTNKTTHEKVVKVGDLVLVVGENAGMMYNTGAAKNISLPFVLSGRSMRFLPCKIMGKVLPNVQSKYGTAAPGRVGDRSFGKAPMVFTWYNIPFALSPWQWSMISSGEFVGPDGTATDLQLEVVMLNFVDYIHVASAYVYWNGHEYKLNNPISPYYATTFEKIGKVSGTQRQFSSEIKVDSPPLHLKVDCVAPTSVFALLDDETITTIHSTVLGSCTVKNVLDGKEYVNHRNALLEIKH